jgi:hypothetical protein
LIHLLPREKVHQPTLGRPIELAASKIEFFRCCSRQRSPLRRLQRSIQQLWADDRPRRRCLSTSRLPQSCTLVWKLCLYLYHHSNLTVGTGPTPTGPPAFLAQTNPAPFASTSYIPNTPLETQVPIAGANGQNIFQLHGQLSHYFPNPDGFGVDEYSLPDGANITWLNMLSRHGSRYPTTGSGAPTFGQKVQNATGQFNATGALSFLNTWNYTLGKGAEILVPVGKQEYVNF